MLKEISCLGKILPKAQQRQINGGSETPGGCREDKGFEWNPLKRCCWSYQLNCCYDTITCPYPWP
ncbi:hypothetical protein [Aquimarina sp. 2201CG5-10]|uniref:hypothetical protein n=1 Tax=Aquimarina callyspongiae TaxID=3098150 RepID=UPI002AB36AC2|nr:hypothetical protein [Aquimarina sp. 2201CG5-10]MDY8137031.1 hypothetical protein [Aquimarina sp. 2201CG5-10]